MAAEIPESPSASSAPAPPPGTSSSGPSPQGTALEADYKDLYLRALAELENYRKRAERDRTAMVLYAGEAVIRKLLDPFDSFDRAIAELEKISKDAPDAQRAALARSLEGLRAVRRQLRDLLVSEGVELVPSEGVAFDPHVHEALVRVPHPTAPEGTILQTLQPGYSMRGKLLRPARVAVASGEAPLSHDASEPHGSASSGAEPAKGRRGRRSEKATDSTAPTQGETPRRATPDHL